MYKYFITRFPKEASTSHRKTRTSPRTLIQNIYLIRRTFPPKFGRTNGIVKSYDECHLFEASTRPVIPPSPKGLPLRAIHKILWNIQTRMTKQSKIGSANWSDQHGIQCMRRSPVFTNLRGTCAMKARAAAGVVDKYLNVYGTKNLKIAGLSISFMEVIVDLSICPGNVGSNTYSTALMIGETAAEIIAHEIDSS
jgi:choline dehydrogenase-like flavoprotein